MIDIIGITKLSETKDLENAPCSIDRSSTPEPIMDNQVDLVEPKANNCRILISESDLLKTHSQEMYLYLSRNLRYEKKVKIDKDQLMMHGYNHDLLFDVGEVQVSS